MYVGLARPSLQGLGCARMFSRISSKDFSEILLVSKSETKRNETATMPHDGGFWVGNEMQAGLRDVTLQKKKRV